MVLELAWGHGAFSVADLHFEALILKKCFQIRGAEEARSIDLNTVIVFHGYYRRLDSDFTGSAIEDKNLGVELVAYVLSARGRGLSELVRTRCC